MERAAEVEGEASVVVVKVEVAVMVDVVMAVVEEVVRALVSVTAVVSVRSVSSAARPGPMGGSRGGGWSGASNLRPHHL